MPTNELKGFAIAFKVNAPKPTGMRKIDIPEIPSARVTIAPVTNAICFIFRFSVAFDICWSVVAKGLNASDIATNAPEPSTINPATTGTPNAATERPNPSVRAAIIPTCLNVISFVAFAILLSPTPNNINAILITAIDIEPSSMYGNTAGIPNIATTPPNKIVKVAITAICLNDTPFVAFVILPSAIPYNIKATLIINILIAPFAIVVSCLLNILNAKTFIATIPNTTSAPRSACIPTFAIPTKSKQFNPIMPVNASNPSDDIILLAICLLFLDNFFATGIIMLTINDNAHAPNIAGITVTSATVKNTDVINK